MRPWCTTSTKESRHRSSTPRRNMYSMILTEPSRPAVRHWQSDPCHSIARMKTFEAKLLKGAACSLLFLQFYIFHLPCLTLTEVDIAICDDVLTIDVCKDLQVSTDILRSSSAIVPPLPVWLLAASKERCHDQYRWHGYWSWHLSLEAARLSTHGIGQWCGRCQSNDCVEGIWGRHLLPATFRSLWRCCLVYDGVIFFA